MSYYKQFHKNVKELSRSSDSTILRELELLKNNPLISANEKRVIGEYLLHYMSKRKAAKFGEAVAAATVAPVAPVAPIAPVAPVTPAVSAPAVSQPALQGNLPSASYVQTAQAVNQAQMALQNVLNTTAPTIASGFGRKRRN